MPESFNLAKRPEGYKLYGPDEGVFTEWALVGPDSLGRYFSVIQTPFDSFVRSRDEHGEPSTFQQAIGIGDEFRCGALDPLGRVWVGEITGGTLDVLDAAGAWDATVALTDGVNTYEP